MTEAVETIHGRRLDARYALISKLGSGGQAEVWRAHDSVRGVDIALKVLNPSLTRNEAAWDALQHEYEISSRLNHPGILKVFAPEHSGDSSVLPMELAAGGDLRRLRGSGFLEIIPVLLEIAQALEHAHERGVVHRDLKPGNVLFDSRSRVRLADFGVAGTVVSSTDAKGVAAGDSGRDVVRHAMSPFTASPAQLRGDPPTPADDIYGLGALAYELLSGYPPYYPNFDRRRAIEDPVPPLVPTRQIPPLLNALVMRMLAKDPRERPQSMREIIDELDASLNETLIFNFDEEGTSVSAEEDDEDADEPVATPPRAAARPVAPPAAPPARPSPASARDGSGSSTGNAHDAAASAARSERGVPAPAADQGTVRIRQPSIGSQLGVGAALRTMFVSDVPAANTADGSVRRRALRDQQRAPPGKAASEPPREREPDSTQPKAQVRPEGHEPPRPEVNAPRRPKADEPPRPEVKEQVRSEANEQVRTQPNGQAHAPSREHWSFGGRERRARMDRRATQRIEPVFNPDPVPDAAPERPGAADSAAPAVSRETPAATELTHSTKAAASSKLPVPARPEQPEGETKHHPFLRGDLTPREPVTSNRRELSTVAWNHIPLDALPRVARLEPIQPRRWPWVVLGLMAGAAAAVYFWLPRFEADMPPELRALVAPLHAALGSQQAPASRESAEDSAATAEQIAAAPSSSEHSPAGEGVAAATAAGAPDAGARDLEERFATMRKEFDARFAALQTRGAGTWGGSDFAAAEMRAAESAGAHDAGNAQLAVERLTVAGQLLDHVEAHASQALAAQLAAGDKALSSGEQEVATQAFTLAKRIDPNDPRAAEGLRRAQSMNGILPLLADGQNAERAHDYARAAQDYSQALSLDPRNAAAQAGQSRAARAFDDDSYAKAVGAGFAALGAGRIEEARSDFNKAHAVKPHGAEAAEGLRRVNSGSANRGFAAVRAKAASLETQERWEEAERTYEAALATDPTLAFAQEGKARAAARADLGERLQQLIDQPDRLAAPAARDQARSLLQTAQSQSPSGPVLRSQIARLQILLPGFDKPVRLSLLSDNSTQVAITRVGAQAGTTRVGSFGVFSRRDITLLPGRYVVVGTRNGFRDVRREITVAPGQDIQTIKVTCSDPI
ncbi:MAG: protein kinase [Sinobacteraceae bacterium]|nr:protein kinase [Nevskiaceae bacterium]